MRKLTAPGWLLRGLGRGVDLLGRVRAIESPITLEGTTYATGWVYGDDSRVREELGLSWRGLDQTLADTIVWLADSGHIKPWWASRLRD
jgi:hypothetical protein